MKWPWSPPTPPSLPNLEKAVEDLEAVIAQRPEVQELNTNLGRHRRMNGFADLVFRPWESR